MKSHFSSICRFTLRIIPHSHVILYFHVFFYNSVHIFAFPVLPDSILDSRPTEPDINKLVGSRMSAEWDRLAMYLRFDLASTPDKPSTETTMESVGGVSQMWSAHGWRVRKEQGTFLVRGGLYYRQ